jgi:hypothetical protein
MFFITGNFRNNFNLYRRHQQGGVMKADTSRYYKKYNKTIGAIVWLICVFILLPCIASATTNGELYRYQGSGKLTGIEGNSTVIIDEKGYNVDPSVLIVNAIGRPVALDTVPLPVIVNFDYSYMPNGPQTMRPVIVYIEEAKQNK